MSYEKHTTATKGAVANKPRGKWWKRILIAAAIIALPVTWWAVREGKPWLDGIQAYIYAFPMVMMDLTREASLSETPGEVTAPMNQFGVMSTYPDASFRAVPRTGLDAMFATSWADLEAEPLVLSVPDTNDRYYVIALFDFWSNVFASIGSRTTGTSEKHFLIAGPGWRGTPPDGVDEVFHAPTNIVWVNGQMRADGSAECPAAAALQRQYKLTPLSAWGEPYTPPARVPIPAVVDTTKTPLQRIQSMTAGEFFSRFARLMKSNPPAADDAPMVEKLRGLGIEPGKDFDIAQADPRMARALTRAMGAFKILEIGTQKLTTKDGWIVMPPNMADYGTDYVTRAGISMVGLGAVQPVDISYPTAFNDRNDKPLDSANRYVLHFDKGQTPPANVLWSVSMYDPEGYYVPNAIDRYHLADWMPLTFNADGSLDVHIQTNSPGPDKEANWLPAPASGPFNLVIRIFWPDEAAVDGTWSPPGVEIAQ